MDGVCRPSIHADRRICRRRPAAPTRDHQSGRDGRRRYKIRFCVGILAGVAGDTAWLVPRFCDWRIGKRTAFAFSLARTQGFHSLWPVYGSGGVAGPALRRSDFALVFWFLALRWSRCA